MERLWIPRLAVRNLLRYRRRTLITAGAIAFGLCFYIWTDSILAGAAEETRRNLDRYETSDGALAAPGYLEGRETAGLEASFPWRVAADELESEGAAAAPRIPFFAQLVFYRDPFPEDGSIPILLTAVHPERDRAVFRLADCLVDGEWLEAGSDGVVLGSWLARDIGAVVAAPLVAVTETRDGYAQAFDLHVAGIIDTPNPEVNKTAAYVALDMADSALEMNDEVTVMHVALPPGLRPRRGGNPMEMFAARRGLDWFAWEELASDFVEVMKTETSGSAVIILLILVIAAVGISNTMLMAVFERSREVGMMRALGMDDRRIRRLFLWESAGIGILGSAFGIVIGAVVNIPLVRRGLDYTFFFREASYGFRITGIFYGSWHAPGFVIAFALGVGLSVLVSALSIRRILVRGIVEDLRCE